MMNTQPGGLDEGDSFPLPLGGLFADLDTGEGALQLPDEFLQAPPQVQLQLIADWQRGLARLRLAAFERLYADLRARHRGASAEEIAQRFQQACRRLGQAWPPEMAGRLQPARTEPAANTPASKNR